VSIESGHTSDSTQSASESEHTTLHVATKKDGARQQRRVVDEDREAVRAWLETQLDKDPFVNEYTAVSYNKLVYESPDGRVLGHVIEVPTLDTVQDEEPDLLQPEQ
jgi:hypothetical protein